MTKMEQWFKSLSQQLLSPRTNGQLSDRGEPVIANISLGFKDGHCHHHFVGSKDDTKLLLQDLTDQTGILPELPNYVDLPEIEVERLPRQIVFHNRQAIGDILMFTTAVRDFKKRYPFVDVKVQSTAGHLWDHNPNLYRGEFQDIVDPLEGLSKPNDMQKLEATKEARKLAISQDRPLRVYIGPGKLTNMSNRTDLHFANAYRMSMEMMLGLPPIPQGPIRPDIYMTEKEYAAPPLIEGKYWIITAGEKGDWTAKTWPPSYFQKLVDLLPEITFVQIGMAGHPHVALKGDNVINYIGKTQDRDTGIRKLFNLFNWCEGSIGLVSFQMHLAAGFGKPCVVIAGAREPISFTRFPGHRYLAKDGTLNCTINEQGEPISCWYCDKKRCPYLVDIDGHETPKCVAMVEPVDVANAVLDYYDGGRLDMDVPARRSGLINVVTDSPDRDIVESLQEKPRECVALPEGHSWGGANITDRDWDFILQEAKKRKVKTILEIGAGLSTILLSKEGYRVVSLETQDKWIQQVQRLAPDAIVIKWDGESYLTFGEMVRDLVKAKTGKESFDMAFVDGPAGGGNREAATYLASRASDFLIIHDANREYELLWQDKHVRPDFNGPIKGGHRCHAWDRKAIKEEPEKEKHVSRIPNPTKRKTIRFLFNGRGEGGAERSTTWMMNQLAIKGHDVEYVPTNKQAMPSGTFRRYGMSDLVRVKDMRSALSGACPDVTVLYSNDWIWDFRNVMLQEYMEKLPMDKKVMVVNFRLGPVGMVPWTQAFDRYIFLNSGLRDGFEAVCPGKRMRVLPPPTDLSEYYHIKPDYEKPATVVRHSSQGDAKYPKNFQLKVMDLFKGLEEEGSSLRLMPAPSYLDGHFMVDKITCHKRNQPSVQEFLGLGNLFWYMLPDGYHDQGPKVIMEAQAAGLACIAPNHSGPKDRINQGGVKNGWLCDTAGDWIAAYEQASDPSKRREFGIAAREHAREQYNPDLWLEEILQN